MTLILSHGADINSMDFNEDTALHCAARILDPLPIVTVLIRSGADLEYRNKSNQTPLNIARESNNFELIRALGGD